MAYNRNKFKLRRVAFCPVPTQSIAHTIAIPSIGLDNPDALVNQKSLSGKAEGFGFFEEGDLYLASGNRTDSPWVRFAGDSLLNRCWIPHFFSEASTIDIPLFVSGVGTGSIECEVQFTSDTGNRYQLCMSHNTASQGWWGLENGLFRWDTRYNEVYIDGVLSTNGVEAVVYDQLYRIRLVDTDASIGIGELGNGYTGGGATWFMRGVLKNIAFKDSANPSLDRFYKGIVKSDTRPLESEPYIDESPNAAHGVLSGFPTLAWREVPCDLPLPPYTGAYVSSYTEEYK